MPSRFFAILILLAGFALRALTLDAQSIWFDEGWSWHLARMPLAEMAVVTAGDRSPVLYYTLLHAVLRIAGDGAFIMRFASLFADVATIALVMALARCVGRAHSASWLWAGVVYALCPIAIWYAQETRMYAQVAALCTASTLLLWRWCARASAHLLVGSALCLALAVHSHYYAIFLLPAQLALVVVLTRRPLAALLRWLICAALVVASVLPWLLFARGGFAYDDGFAFPLNAVDVRLTEWLSWFVAGSLPREAPAWAFALLGAALSYGLLRALLSGRRREALALLAIAIVPVLAAVVAVRVIYPYRSVFHPRYLIYAVPALCVLATAGAARGRIRAILLPGLSALALLGAWLPALQGYFNDPAMQRDNVRDATRHVIDALEPGDAVVMTRDNYAIRYYFPAAARSALIAAPEGLHGLLTSDQVVLDALNPLQPKRVRLMLWQDLIVDPQRLLETTLWANGRQLGEFDFGQIRLPLYQIDQRPLQPAPLRPFNASFAGAGDAFALRAAWFSRRARAGDWFYAVLEWRVKQRIARDYKAFVHVLDASGMLVFQQDKVTLNELLPTRTWTPGVALRDAYAMVVPADLPAGRYRVVAGLYDPATGMRLRVTNVEGNDLGDTIELGDVEIVRP